MQRSSAFPLFINRANELDRLAHAFQQGVRGVVLFGIGGAGKTALAQTFARRYPRFFPGGVHATHASPAENAVHMLRRLFERPPNEASLLIVDDVDRYD